MSSQGTFTPSSSQSRKGMTMRWHQTSISSPPKSMVGAIGRSKPSPGLPGRATTEARGISRATVVSRSDCTHLSVYLRGFYEHSVASLWVSPLYSQESVHFTHGKVEVHEPEQLFLMLYSISCEKVHEVPISWCLCCCGSAEIQKPEHYNTKNHLWALLTVQTRSLC